MIDKINQFLQSQKYCTISTVNGDGFPQAALVAFSSTPDLRLVIGTSRESRKFKNIMEKQNVAIVVANEDFSVQYEGLASADSVSVEDELVQQHFKKSPGSLKYQDDDTQTWIKITPNWTRFIEHRDNGLDLVTELTEFS